MREEDFRTITRRDRFQDVVDGLAAASEAGLGPVKVNAVLMRGINDDQAPELLQWCMDHGYHLRFIEQMPLDAQHGWSRDKMVTADEIFESLRGSFVLEPAEEPRGSAPAELFSIDGGPHTVGVIASVTRPFCGDCDRVRLTADGQVRNCLFAREESDLRARPPWRRRRRDHRRPVEGRDAHQAAGPRHRRPDFPPAQPADVGHRRLGARWRGPIRRAASHRAAPTRTMGTCDCLLRSSRPARSSPRSERSWCTRARRVAAPLSTDVVCAPGSAAPAGPEATRPTLAVVEELDLPDVAKMYLPLTQFGNVTLGDSVKLTKALRTEALRWERPLLHLEGGTALEFPGDESVWAKLGGDVERLQTIGRGVPQVVSRLGFFVDRRQFRPWLSVGTINDHTTAPFLEGVVQRLDAFRGASWTVESISLMKGIPNEGPDAYEVMEELPLAEA